MNRIFYLIIFFSVISCNKEKRNTSDIDTTNDKTLENVLTSKESAKDPINQEKKYFRTDKIDFFDFNKLPLSKDIDELSNNITDEFRLDSLIANTILKEENYYKLLYYYDLGKYEEFNLFTVFGNYDYYTNILLVTKDNKTGKLIDFEIIASIIGDADNMSEISSKFIDSNTVKITTNLKKLSKEEGFKLLESKTEILKVNLNGKMKKIE